MSRQDETIKVLWPDGPRWVPAEKIKAAALDALCNEEGFGSDLEDDALQEVINSKRAEMSLDEALEIVNRHGYYTTASRDVGGEGVPPHDHATATGMYDRD